mmetsp:Transcript_58252/g.180731  ORF Transcript_58252/g.180731 Transcript_58252/m.180731 type:complete len:277 (-) Transcript_58252:40-870(-)
MQVRTGPPLELVLDDREDRPVEAVGLQGVDGPHDRVYLAEERGVPPADERRHREERRQPRALALAGAHEGLQRAARGQPRGQRVQLPRLARPPGPPVLLQEVGLPLDAVEGLEIRVLCHQVDRRRELRKVGVEAGGGVHRARRQHAEELGLRLQRARPLGLLRARPLEAALGVHAPEVLHARPAYEVSASPVEVILSRQEGLGGARQRQQGLRAHGRQLQRGPAGRSPPEYRTQFLQELALQPHVVLYDKCNLVARGEREVYRAQVRKRHGHLRRE